MKKKNNRLVGVLLACILILVCVVPALAADNSPSSTDNGNLGESNTAFSMHGTYANTKYYISSTDGNDSNTGLSESAPWKSLDKISGNVFKPGDSILFKCGDEWDGTVRFYGSGSKESPIYVGSYGIGAKPILNGEGDKEAGRTLLGGVSYGEISGTLEIIEGSYWHVDSLEITNNKSGSARYRVGIFVFDDCKTDVELIQTPQHGITITDCYVHDVVSDDTEKRTGGIVLMGNINDVLIDNNIIENVSVSGIRNTSWIGGIPQFEGIYLQNYKVSNNVLKNIGGDVIVLGSVENGVMEYNYVNGYCVGDPQKDYAALWTYNCKDVVIQYNEITGGGSTNSDGTPFDVDALNTNILIQYNYTHDNQKGIAMFIPGSSGAVFRYNISINDGQQKDARLFPYAITTLHEAPLIYNNIIYQSSALSSKGLFNNSAGNNDLYVKFYNNIVIAPDSLRLSVQNTIKNGEMDGNIFLPGTLISNSANQIGDGVYGVNNITADRTSLSIPQIERNTAPTGVITGYNTFDTSQLLQFEQLRNIFATPIGNGVNAERLDSLGSVPPAVVDFFGNPISNITVFSAGISQKDNISTGGVGSNGGGGDSNGGGGGSSGRSGGVDRNVVSGANATTSQRPKVYTKAQFDIDWVRGISKLPAGQKTMIIRAKNYTSVDKTVLDYAYEKAKVKGIELIFHFDTYNNTLTNRIYITPSEKNFTVQLINNDLEAKITKKFTNVFNNKIKVISINIPNNETIHVAVKLPSSMSTSNLVLYRYDVQSNTYSTVNTATLSVGNDGYAHITAQNGGYIISEGEFNKTAKASIGEKR